MGVLYSATNFQGMFNLLNMLPVVGYERNVFYRCPPAQSLTKTPPEGNCQEQAMPSLHLPSSVSFICLTLLALHFKTWQKYCYALKTAVNRERAAKMYARASYITAVGIVELPYIAAQTIVFVPISYIMIGKLTVMHDKLTSICHDNEMPDGPDNGCPPWRMMRRAAHPCGYLLVPSYCAPFK